MNFYPQAEVQGSRGGPADANVTGNGSNLTEIVTENGSNLTEIVTENGSNLTENVTENGSNLTENVTENGSNLTENVTENGSNLTENVTENGCPLGRMGKLKRGGRSRRAVQFLFFSCKRLGAATPLPPCFRGGGSMERILTAAQAEARPDR
jgi:hypothetical protein